MPDDPKPARTVKLVVGGKDDLQIKDKDAGGVFFGAGPDISLDTVLGKKDDLKQPEIYGWKIRPFIRDDLFTDPWKHAPAAQAEVCTNEADSAEHRNTLAPPPRELIKLDAGFWGHYFHDDVGWGILDKAGKGLSSATSGIPVLSAVGSILGIVPKLTDGIIESTQRAVRQKIRPSREFGIIEGPNVLLCQWTSNPTSDNPKTKKILDDLGCPHTKALLAVANERDCAFSIRTYATAQRSSATRDLFQGVTLVFSDLHLPERFAPLPKESDRFSIAGDPEKSAEIRASLREDLEEAQVYSNPLLLRFMSDSDKDAIQKHLDRLELGENVPWTQESGSLDPSSLSSLLSSPDTPNLSSLASMASSSNHAFSPTQFLAEKDYVDRRYQIESNWFYPPGIDEVHSDPSPAIDLLHLLHAAITLRERIGSGNVRVIQVGDLFELWINREFMYLDFPVYDKEATGEPTLAAIAMTARDGYQYRYDKVWANDLSRAQRSKHYYIYHHWDQDDLQWGYRTTTKNNLADLREHVGEARCRRKALLLLQRVQSVREFRLPAPPDPASLPEDVRKKINDSENLRGSYSAFVRLKDKNPALFASPAGVDTRGRPEYLWNKMILEAFATLAAQKIWGNHDGYRGDPILNSLLSQDDRAEGWVSHPGLWVEHNHRWDEYNRDGFACGAGVTNLVYFHRHGLIAADALQSKILISQEQKAFQPGALLWFLLVNNEQHQGSPLRDFLSKGNKTVHPFAIYACGHTHAPDLVRMVIEQDT